MDYDVEFYQKENGDVPVLDFLLSIQPKMRAKAYSEMELLKKHGPALREPYVKPIKGNNNKGIYELRIRYIAYILFLLFAKYIVLLNGFAKKTNKTPEQELEKARKYKADYKIRCNDDE